MTPFEYVLALVSILVGLAVADLATSLHRLLRARRTVRWDWLPLVSAVIVVLLILNFWWAFYSIGQNELWTRFWAFLVLASYLVCLFLLASAALPDEIPEAGIDLREYYHDNARYFWLLFAISSVPSTAIMVLSALGRVSGDRIIVAVTGNVVMVAVHLSLARWLNRRYHAAIVPLVLVLLGLQWWRIRLG